MCGILATIGASPDLVEARGPRALRTLAHRGPDDEGSWSDGMAWLGHRRLAIIDLTAAGHQPMVHDQSGVVITFNGEIYNYVELRRDLESAGMTFKSRSDTEVLLAAYLKWGEECLHRLNGMWAFLVWDPRVQRAFFARDRLGEKPLFFRAGGDGSLAVASEPKALLELFPQNRRVDDQAMYSFLAEGQLYAGDRSFYSGISVLEPGHCATFEPGATSCRVRRYWAPPGPSDPSIAYEQAVTTFGELLDDSVRLRMRSDVPVGFTLSGGLDSSAVLQSANAVTAGSPVGLKAYTAGYGAEDAASGADERRWAAEAAAPFERVDLLRVEAGEDWLATLEQIAWHMDGPGYSPAVFPLWRIMEVARTSGVPVLLEGQGADELLGGYTTYAALSLWEELRRGRLRHLQRNAKAYAGTFSRRMLLLWMVRERIPSTKTLYRRKVGALSALDPTFVRAMGFMQAPRSPGTVDGRLRDDITRAVLPGLLHYGDAISMAHSVESRLPFLDHRLVDFASALPASYKVGQGQTKRLLRDHLRERGLDRIASRRYKQGFTTPADTWLKANDGALARSLLLAPDASILAYCTRAGIENLIDRHVSGHAGSGNHLYRLLTTEIWLRRCLSGS